MWYYFPPWLQAVSDYLAHTQLSLALQTTLWMIPAIQSVHIACVCIVLGSYLMLDLSVLGIAGHSLPIAVLSRRFLPWVWCALAVLLVTGSLLMIAEPGRDLNNPTFQLKMILVIAISLATYVLQSPLKTNANYWEATPVRRAIAKLIAATSLATLVVIVYAGRWIAYTIVSD